MRRVLGYLDGRAIWSDNEPSRGRVAGYGGSALGHALTPTASAQAVRRREERLRDLGRKRHGRVG